VRITVAGHDQYGAWRESTHDGLVLAGALWWEEHVPGHGWLRLMERGLTLNLADLTGR